MYRRTKGSGAVEFEQLVGQWRLVRARMYSRDGSTSAHMYGPNPNGVLLYTPDGGMSATIESTSGGIAVCYAGRVTLADSAVTHNVLVGDTRFPAGTEQVRHASFDSDGHLNLTVHYPDGAVQLVLVWQRGNA